MRCSLRILFLWLTLGWKNKNQHLVQLSLTLKQANWLAMTWKCKKVSIKVWKVWFMWKLFQSRSDSRVSNVRSCVMPFQLYHQSTFSLITFLTKQLYSSLAQLFATFKIFGLVSFFGKFYQLKFCTFLGWLVEGTRKGWMWWWNV